MSAVDGGGGFSLSSSSVSSRSSSSSQMLTSGDDRTRRGRTAPCCSVFGVPKITVPPIVVTVDAPLDQRVEMIAVPFKTNVPPLAVAIENEDRTINMPVVG